MHYGSTIGQQTAKSFDRLAQDISSAPLGNCAVRETDLARILGRIQQSHKMVLELNNRVERIGNEVYGAVPQCGEANGRDIRSGQIGQIEDALDYLSAAIDSVHAGVGRIEGLA